tara:strand:+ start:97 stop:909 length:813 start_codon:yes stop_codon:yes gene_type:complete
MSFATVAIIGASVAGTAALAKLGVSLAGYGKRKEEQEKAREEMDKYKEKYKNLDTSNIYANVKNPYADIQTDFENVYEDITVNQQQAEFQRQTMQQSQANIMQQMRGAAGGSGIAALAQAMANQGQLGAQQISASIGQQEAMNQRLIAQGAAKEQELERLAEIQVAQGEGAAQMQRLRGAEQARGLEWGKTSTLLGMSQQRLGAANQAIAQAKAQQMEAIGDFGSAGMDLATAGMKMNTPGTSGELHTFQLDDGSYKSMTRDEYYMKHVK